MDYDPHAQQRLHHLRAYMRLLEEAGLLRNEDATCKLFALIDDDRKRMHTFPQVDLEKKLLPASDVLGDIKANPERHRHTYNELYNCAYIAGNDGSGVIDLRIIEAHAQYVNVGHPGCDVTEGPCACGGIHRRAMPRDAG